MKPEQGSKSLEKTVGNALDVGKTELVSNTSLGPSDNAWLAGPQLGKGAQALYDNMSKRYGGR